MKPIKLKIKTKTQNYPIIIGSDLISKFSKIIKQNSLSFNKCLLVVDSNVPKKFIAEIKKSLKKNRVFVCFFKANETNKNFLIINKILETLLIKNFSREDCLMSIGGGITGDVSGFAASQFKRGLKFINIPTTLLGMVDAAHGGKTGIDFKLLKNQIGVFSDPSEVILDSEYLNTLSKDEFLNGYAEIFKHSLLTNKRDLNFNSLINLDFYEDVSFIIDKYSEIKNEIVRSDKFESNYRKILNLGHTIGHAIESYSFRSINLDELKHGEAIIVGLITELYISHRQLNFPLSDLENLKTNVLKYFKRVHLTESDIEEIYDLLVYDKKNEGGIVNFVLLKSIGDPVVDQQTTKELFIESFKFYNKD